MINPLMDIEGLVYILMKKYKGKMMKFEYYSVGEYSHHKFSVLGESLNTTLVGTLESAEIIVEDKNTDLVSRTERYLKICLTAETKHELIVKDNGMLYLSMYNETTGKDIYFALYNSEYETASIYDGHKPLKRLSYQLEEMWKEEDIHNIPLAGIAEALKQFKNRWITIMYRQMKYVNNDVYTLFIDRAEVVVFDYGVFKIIVTGKNMLGNETELVFDIKDADGIICFEDIDNCHYLGYHTDFWENVPKLSDRAKKMIDENNW